ncbi:hypothetical protein [Amycolatopsis sp. cmx-11-12]
MREFAFNHAVFGLQSRVIGPSAQQPASEHRAKRGLSTKRRATAPS